MGSGVLRAVFFDAFGTLLDAEGLHLRATEEILSRLGIRGLDAGEIHEAWDRRAELRWGRGNFMPIRELFGVALAEVLADRGFELGRHDLSEAIAILVETFRKGARPYGDSLEVLSFCRELGLKTGVISDADSEVLRHALTEHGLMDYLDVVVISDEVGCLKPDEGIFRAALSEAGCGPGEALMVGDAARDVVGARRIGMPVALVVRPRRGRCGRAGMVLAGEVPDIIVQNLRELKGPIAALARGLFHPPPLLLRSFPRP